MDSPLVGKKIAFLTANEGVEQVELTEPWKALTAGGAAATLIAPEAGEVQCFHHLTAADSFEVGVTSDRADADDYDALVLPGGVANPDQLRRDRPAIELIRAFVKSGRPIAVICHGPWTLVEADVVRDRVLTSWPSLRTDIENAGGRWVDQAACVCSDGPNTIISSRNPDDIPAFIEAIVDELTD